MESLEIVTCDVQVDPRGLNKQDIMCLFTCSPHLENPPYGILESDYKALLTFGFPLDGLNSH